MKLGYVMKTTSLGLALAFAGVSNAFAAAPGTGQIECDITFTVTTPEEKVSESVNVLFNITYDEADKVYLMSGMSVDSEGTEEIEQQEIAVVKKGKSYVATFSSFDAEDDVRFENMLTYPARGGDTKYQVRENGGKWVNLLNFKQSEGGYKITFKGECNFTPAE